MKCLSEENKIDKDQAIVNEDGTIEKYGITFSDNEILKTYDMAIEQFAQTLFPNRPIDLRESAGGWYDAIYANNIVKDITTPPSVPDLATLTDWLRNPAEAERGLTGLSQYLDYSVFQYRRSVKHFASMFTYNYHLVPLSFPENEDGMKAFKRNEAKVIDWLKKFRVKEQLRNVMEGVMLEDAKYFYVRESKDYIDLQEMPSEYCYITGDSSIGFRFAFNMVWFAQYGYTDKGFPRDSFAPEFEDWFNEFLVAWRKYKSRIVDYYQPLNRDKSVVFKFDDNRAGVVPPLSGVFKDALDIQEYKDLLKTKTKLDTWKIVFQQIPLNKDTGKPAIDSKTIGKFVALTQARMPEGTKTMASPMAPTAINFESAQTKDNITGTANANYWDRIGIARAINGGGDVNSAGAIKYSVIGDYGFISGMLNQFERFINHQLKLITGNYKFEVKFVENDTIYNNQDNQDKTLKSAQFGAAGSKSKLVAVNGLEPHQAKHMTAYEKYLGYEEWVPLNSSHVGGITADEGGRVKKDVTDLSESGENTQNYDSNDNKV